MAISQQSKDSVYEFMNRFERLSSTLHNAAYSIHANWIENIDVRPSFDNAGAALADMFSALSSLAKELDQARGTKAEHFPLDSCLFAIQDQARIAGELTGEPQHNR